VREEAQGSSLRVTHAASVAKLAQATVKRIGKQP
jgi:hypothetical protein